MSWFIGDKDNTIFIYFTLICDTLVHVTTRNVTFNLPVELMRQAKIYAAEHDTTRDDAAWALRHGLPPSCQPATFPDFHDSSATMKNKCVGAATCARAH